MKTLHKSIIIALSCFCAVDLVFIQSDFFISCILQHTDYHLLGPNDCDAYVHFLQAIFGIAAGIGIGAIVGISAIYSPKKSLALVAATAGIFLLFVVLSNTLLPYVHPMPPPGIMRAMTRTEIMVLTMMRSPLWWVLLYAAMISSIVWSLVMLRKKMRRLSR